MSSFRGFSMGKATKKDTKTSRRLCKVRKSRVCERYDTYNAIGPTSTHYQRMTRARAVRPWADIADRSCGGKRIRVRAQVFAMLLKSIGRPACARFDVINGYYYNIIIIDIIAIIRRGIRRVTEHASKVSRHKANNIVCRHSVERAGMCVGIQ